jgi:hypothetical protein
MYNSQPTGFLANTTIATIVIITVIYNYEYNTIVIVNNTITVATSAGPAKHNHTLHLSGYAQADHQWYCNVQRKLAGVKNWLKR